MGKTTKSGRNLNPTDAFRKEQRKKELKKNKKVRAIVRENSLVHKDPTKIQDQIGKLAVLEDQGKLDKRLKAKKKQLEDTFDAVVKKKQELAQINPNSDLLRSSRPSPAPTPPGFSGLPGIGGAPLGMGGAFPYFMPPSMPYPGLLGVTGVAGVPGLQGESLAAPNSDQPLPPGAELVSLPLGPNPPTSTGPPPNLPLPPGPPPQGPPPDLPLPQGPAPDSSASFNIPLPAGPPPGIPPPPPPKSKIAPTAPASPSPDAAQEGVATTEKTDSPSLLPTPPARTGLIPPPPPPRQGVVPPPPPPRAPPTNAPTGVLPLPVAPPVTTPVPPLPPVGLLPTVPMQPPPTMPLPTPDQAPPYFNNYPPYPAYPSPGYFPPQPMYNPLLSHMNSPYPPHPSLAQPVPAQPPAPGAKPKAAPQIQSQPSQASADLEDDTYDNPHEFHAGMIPASLRVHRLTQTPRPQQVKRRKTTPSSITVTSSTITSTATSSSSKPASKPDANIDDAFSDFMADMKNLGAM